jgi:hypothetical protein
MVAIMTVLVLPPNESFKILVSLESRYGMCSFLPSTNADITFPNALKDKLILAAYLIPSSLRLVLLCRSDPAKSTKFNLPTLNFWTPFMSYSLY